jgi:2-succinyl-5-enolpyruvyl-6-hydroxy-3-cyclohexene-1-carboxylate synthase
VGVDVSDAPNRNVAFATALLSELAAGGLGHVCLSPGSRSAPLAIGALRTPGLERSVHLDERSAAFFALGLAKASRAPVALVCTSGTAAANYLPAVVEAHYARVPLVVLTADRPPELRGWGAGQTIDQVELYGSHVRWFADVALPERSLLGHARALAARALSSARGGPAGPVHLNLPFREPLDLREDRSAGVVAAGERGRAGAYTDVCNVAAELDPQSAGALVDALDRVVRGVVCVGPIDASPRFAEAVVGLAQRTGWPVLADAASSLRGGPHTLAAPLVAHHDLLLRDASFARAFAPEIVLQLGDAPTSKALRLWLEAHPPREWVRVDPDRTWHDPSHLASRVIHAEPTSVCRTLGEALSSGVDRSWQEGWLAADTAAGDALAAAHASDDALLEPRVASELAAALPEDALLYVSSSMPIRDLDAFLPLCARRLRVLCNRGANGIDGVLSSALGAAAADAGPSVLFTGDLALLHDASGLLAAKRLGASLTIVVVDNAGGGIFSFLPIAEHGDAVAFEELFLTPQDVDVEALCRAAGLGFTRVVGWEHFRAACKEALASDGVCVLHVRVDRERSVERFRALAGTVSNAWREIAS